jgi:menaquinol-cytochrome c reductase iron-sulfur subunit
MLEHNNPTRRTFHTRAVGFLGALMGAAMALPAAAYLLIKPKSQDTGEFIEVAELNQLIVGKPEEIIYHRTRVDGWKKMEERATTWVLRTGEHTAVAYSPACTHLGCAYHWEDESQNFLCPCHTSIFGADGAVVRGPAARPLDRYVSKVAEGRFLISSQLETV